MKWHFNFFRFAVMCAAFVALLPVLRLVATTIPNPAGTCLVGEYLFVSGGGSVTFTVAFEGRGCKPPRP